MGYIKPSTRKVNKTKSPEIETVSKKKYWIILDNKGRLVSVDGMIPMFYRRKDALEYLDSPYIRDIVSFKGTKLEKLDVMITR